MDGEPVALIHADDPRLQRMAVLDVLINNADRKGGHALEGSTGPSTASTTASACTRENKLRTVLWGWAGTEVPAPSLVDIAELISSLGATSGRDWVSTSLRRGRRAVRASPVDLLAAPVMPRPNGHRPIPWPAF